MTYQLTSDTTSGLLNEVAREAGWTGFTQLAILMEYVENQADPGTLRDFLQRKLDDEAEDQAPEFQDLGKIIFFVDDMLGENSDSRMIHILEVLLDPADSEHQDYMVLDPIGIAVTVKGLAVDGEVEVDYAIIHRHQDIRIKGTVRLKGARIVYGSGIERGTKEWKKNAFSSYALVRAGAIITSTNE